MTRQFSPWAALWSMMLGVFMLQFDDQRHPFDLHVHSSGVAGVAG